MKKLILSMTIITMSSCSSDKCDLKGCNEKGIGWENYKDNSACMSWGACKVKENGGYCSKDHALKGLSQ